MRLGGPVHEEVGDVEGWVRAVLKWGYRAVYWPLESGANEGMEREYVEAARRADLVIAEVGAWSNPISKDAAERKRAVAFCQERLAAAERVGAVCCVNIAGSRGAKWDGPDAGNFSVETFDLIVETVREIVDAVKPVRSCYSLETMPWAIPDSAESYLEVMRAIDRKGFGVHLDPVNMVNCPRRACDTGGFLRECFRVLGPLVRSCHAKDIRFTQHLTVHLDECRPGTGVMDYRVFLAEMGKLGADVPLMLEHLPNDEEYRLAGDFVRGVMREVGLRDVFTEPGN